MDEKQFNELVNLMSDITNKFIIDHSNRPYKEQPDVQITKLLNQLFDKYLSQIIIDYFKNNFYPIYESNVKYNVIIKQMNYDVREEGCCCNSCYQYDFIDDKSKYKTIIRYKFFDKYYALKRGYYNNNLKFDREFVDYSLIDDKYIVTKERLDEVNKKEWDEFQADGGDNCGGGLFGDDDGW